MPPAPTAGLAANEDWDASRVEPGCLVKFQIQNKLNGYWTNQTSDRRGRGTEWIRVHDYEMAFVNSRSCG